MSLFVAAVSNEHTHAAVVSEPGNNSADPEEPLPMHELHSPLVSNHTVTGRL